MNGLMIVALFVADVEMFDDAAMKGSHAGGKSSSAFLGRFSRMTAGRRSSGQGRRPGTVEQGMSPAACALVVVMRFVRALLRRIASRCRRIRRCRGRGALAGGARLGFQDIAMLCRLP